MTLHPESLATAAFAVSLALTAALTAMGAFLKGQPGLRKWILALWLACAGTVLLALRGSVPEAIPVLGGHLMLSLSAAMTWVGMAEFCGRPVEVRRALELSAIYIGVHAFFLLVHPSLGIRSINYILMSIAWNLAIAWMLLRHGPKELTGSSRLVAGLFLADTLFNAGVLLVRATHPLAANTNWLGSLEVAQYLEGLVAGTLETLGLAILLSHRLFAQLQQAARSDGLTGILNRRTLDEEAARLLEICQRQGLPCAVLMADVDHFKHFNDAHGHLAGDEALRHLAKLIGPELRKTDLFGRYGGEEFTLFLPGSQGPQALAVADRFRALVASRPVTWVGAELPLTISVGVAAYGGAGPVELMLLYTEADKALYLAKERGRNRVELTPD